MKKKLIAAIAVLAVILAVLLIIPEKLAVSDETGATGELVYLEVSLEKTTIGNSMGIEYVYDENLLEIQPDKCQWVAEGVLSDFSFAKPQGVWASEESVELNGAVCVLAFKILPDADYQKTQVKCTLSVRDGQGREKSFSASGDVLLLSQG